MSDSFRQYYYDQYDDPQNCYGQQAAGYSHGDTPGNYSSTQYQQGQRSQYAYNQALPTNNHYVNPSPGSHPAQDQQSYAPSYDARQPDGHRHEQPTSMRCEQSSSYLPQTQHRQGQNVSYYQTQSEPVPTTDTSEGEKGFISHEAGVIGRGALSHKLGDGMLGVAGGALAGAAGMNIASKLHSRATAAAPTPRGPTRAQLERSKKLRKKELREEIARLKELEREYHEDYINALEDAGIVVPEGVLPPTRVLTEAQRLRKRELRRELERLKALEQEYREDYNVKKDEWSTSRKELEDQLSALDQAYLTPLSMPSRMLV
ncbi:hypothetical protein BO79DRAFT_171403, partial [Aspergillus costaricaensis CBS 115574]